MSLFPAYDLTAPSQSSEVEIVDSRNDAIWLKNSSFQPEIIPGSRVISISSDSSDDELFEIPEEKAAPVIPLDSDIEELHHYSPPPAKKPKKSKKHKSSKEAKPKIKYELVVENVYFDDRVRDKGNLRVDTLCARARPLYTRSYKTLGFVSLKYKKKQLLRRYFALSPEAAKKSTKKLKSEAPPPQNDPQLSPEFLSTLQQTKEEETKLKIKEFNEQLSEDPQNIDLWLQYINFEDRDQNFEVSPHSTKAETVKYQRKLAIMEKALEGNPDSPLLLKCKLNFLSELSPADQYSSQLELLISKDPGNLILWQALITATRSSIALCTAPKVLALYSNCFASLHLWSRSTPQSYDSNLLQMLYQCLIFLRHAGLWEQMWETLRMLLTLNLGVTRDSKNFKGSIDEKKLIGMEEVILTSQLPLNQLWLRVELLRENCHWTTVQKEDVELIGDSHRFISPEDVTEFVHPLLSTGSNFRLGIYALLALKVPLLPTRHVILEELGMDECNWSIDSAESLLPMLFPCVGEVAGHRERICLLKGLIEGGITSGPQYLKYHPAQEGFVDFIRDAFRIIAERLNLEEKNQIYVWWMRLERSLVGVQKAEGIRNEKSIKKLKGILKEFLKREENRNNLDFYREYAVIEREMGRWENCMSILETAIESRGNVILDIKNVAEQRSVLSLYRTLVECLLDTRTWDVNNKIRIMKIFARMSSGASEGEQIRGTEEYLKDSCEEFINAPGGLDAGLGKYFQPNFYCDAVMCYVYLLYVGGRDFEEIHTLFERCIERSRENRYLEEVFCEGELIFKQMAGEHRGRRLDDLKGSLDSALKKFPDNFYMLSMSSAVESELPNWCVRTSISTKRLWPAISMCLSGRARLNSKVCQKDAIARTAALNKLLHFHKRLSKIPEIRCCPLIWRLYMLLLREQNLCEKKGEEVYHESVASCPWARCIYIDAAEIAPQLLTQIQDVIKEKDLRMHVTPEELDILRG
ncbi:protein NRDE2 homolog [Diachasma alloeum]|uniref:protein NRDE2 homolog n=1 Tax=Diachasma alloeum TaxID=454923 RepID=UPI00073836B0|nr:protein NRDE2 homolog [Diachasma alloeum]